MHFLRQLLQGWVGKLAIVIISLTFIISLFAGSIIAQGAKGEAVVIGEQVITVEQIRQRVDEQKAQWRERMGEQANETLINSLVNEASVKSELVNESLLRNYALNSGMQISDETLSSIIRKQEMFLDDKGVFSESLFNQVLKNSGTTPAFYKNYIANNLVLTQLRHGISNSSFDVDKQHELAQKLNEQTRDFSYVVIEKEAFKNEVSVTDDEVLVYYNSNPERFMTEETAVFDYIRVEKSALEAQITPTEDDIQDAYENMVGEWRTQEQRNLATIQLDTNSADFTEKKEAVEQGIAAGTDFATLAKEYSDDILSSQNGGEIGFITMGTFGADFDGVVFGLEAGEISEPVAEDDMLYYAKLLEVKSVDIKPLEEVRAEAESMARVDMAEDRFSDYEVTLDERIYDGYALTEIAEELGLSVDNSGATPVQGSFGWLADPQFVAQLNTAESLEDFETSMVRLTDGSLIAFKVSEYNQAEAKPIEAVKDIIISLVKDEKSTDIAKQKADDALARLQSDSGVTLEALATEFNQPVETKEAVKRDNTEVARDISAVAFKAPKPTAGKSSYTTGELTSRNYVILALNAVAEPATVVSEETVSQINGLRAAEDGSGMLAYIRDNTKIKEFENNLESAE